MAERLDKCVWMWAGLLTFRLCDRNYECSACPVETLFHPRGVPVGHGIGSQPREAGARMSAFPAAAPDRFHDKQHLWLRILPRRRAQIGLDPMAARLLGAAVDFTLPRPGERIRRGGRVVVAHLNGGSVSFTSPVSGTVERTHAIPATRIPRTLSRPYVRAWMVILEVPRLERLLARFSVGLEARRWLAREWGRFQEECLGLVGSSLGPRTAVPDGGQIDLANLVELARPETLSLIAQWIGEKRTRSGGPDASPGRRHRGGKSKTPGVEPPAER